MSPIVNLNPIRHSTRPTELAAGPSHASAGPELPGGALAIAHHFLPVHQPPGQLQACAQQVTTKIQQLSSRQVFTQKLHTRLIELMRLIKNGNTHAGQQLGHAGFAHGQIGKKQVMIDNYHISRHGLAPGQIHMTVAKLGALGTEAILAGRRYKGQQRRSLIKTSQLGQVAGFGRLRPLVNFGQNSQSTAICNAAVLPGQRDAVQANITGATLEQRGTNWYTQSLNQARQVATKKLVLQSLGRGRNQHTLAAKYGGYQVRISFTNACGGFNHQRFSVLNCVSNRHCHGKLAVAYHKVIIR